ncbi:MAG: HIT domain-containing protein [Actinobacteria bacterium]|jgi:histidine triad (HIT) family protein|nr:HIT domain-containing protein [Actinomycetota bacterium]
MTGMSECLFCAIGTGDIPADIVFSDDAIVAFRDISPQAPVHVLVIPRAHHANAAELAAADPALAAALLETTGRVARQEGIAETGYRVVTNTGEGAGQSVQHIHFHVLGGRALAWPPG